MTIREAVENDFPEWLRMRRSLYSECNSKLLLSEIEKIFRYKSVVGELDYIILVYEMEDGELAGFIETSLRQNLPNFESSQVGYIESLYVDAIHRRKGIARQLVELSEKWVHSKRCNHFFVDTDPQSKGSIDFYQSIGFKEINRNEMEVLFKKAG